MKRILALLFVVAMAFTVMAGCACNQCPQECLDIIDQRISGLDGKYQTDVAAAQAAADRAEAAAQRAEAAADRAEAIFMKNLKK